MKKFLSLLIAVLMVATMLPTVSMADTTEAILIRCDNMTITGGSTVYTMSTPGSYYGRLMDGDTYLPLITMAGGSGAAEEYVTASVYLEGNKTYYVWALAQQERPVGVAFDDASFTRLNTYTANSNDTVMNWSTTTGAGFSLTPGLHTVKIHRSSGNGTNMQAILITDDATYKPATDTATYDVIKAFAHVDTTAPSFAANADVSVETDASNNSLITFPAASDGANTALAYEYTINGTTSSISDITSPVNVGVLSGETEVTLTVYDKLGYSASKTFSVTAPESGGGEEPPVEPEDEIEELLLTAENFYLSGISSAINTTGLTGKLFTNSINVAKLDAISARFYIKTAGTYTLQFLTGAGDTNTDTERYPVVTVDENTSNLDFTGPMTWKNITEVFEAGWHTVSLTTSAEWKPYFFNALFITNDSSFELTVDNDDSYGTYIPDTTAPVIGEADIVTEFNGGNCIATFPAATGADGETIIYEYTIGETTTLITDITAPVNVGSISGDTTITFTASDKYGNSASKSVTVSAPVTQWMLTWNNFVLPESTYWTCDSSKISLGAKSIQPNGSVADKAKAMIYVEADGNYAVWALNHNSGSDTPTRVPAIYIDGVKDTSTFNAEYAWKWAKGAGPEGGNGYWTLTKGWHTIEFGLAADWSRYYMDAIYITGNLTEELDINSDNALLAAHGGNSVYVNGELYMAKGLEKAGVAVEDSCANITPVVANATGSAATVTVNGAAASWDVAASVDLANVINTVTIDSSDDTADCTFKVASVGKVINHADEAATVTGYAESEFVGADGTNAVSISGEGSAKFSAQGVTGNTEVWVYVIGAQANGSLADVTVADTTGSKSYNYTNTAATSQWVKLGDAYFSGDADEYVEIKANGTATVYVDSVKFKKADDFVLSSAQKVEDNGTVKFVYEFYKQSKSNVKPVAIIAGYSGDSLDTVSFVETVANDAGIYTFTTNPLTVASGITYRGYIWESFANCKPLASDMN